MMHIIHTMHSIYLICRIYPIHRHLSWVLVENWVWLVGKSIGNFKKYNIKYIKKNFGILVIGKSIHLKIFLKISAQKIK